ncbi:A/G-specific adenine glycosylase [Thioalkalivibrio thiocyanodenitrificans]|uniref:A/G-specific adenine glycosylase n=1 Tax=Thioalkalivibrio thiocyanodenitrificans TaxID=243063 RepID=UPI0003700B5B|nr:A/G-specific adenine glycosylase [Thioalkalivibrio thiocyanodenitrificans]
MSRSDFSQRLLAWYDRHGRHDLPWQQDPTPYRVWVSEIMLQQTQVGTVIPYFRRFMDRFPSVDRLAGAPLDDVLHHWSGLGYYARARNLHKAAQVLCVRHGGRFPRDPEALEALPGIGRSTAGAILSLAFGERRPILDGNVRRVLARHAGIEGWSGSSAVLGRLWRLAEERTPGERVAHYTQAIMDLGATVCTRTRPACAGCPVARDCVARVSGRTGDLPTPRPKRSQPLRDTCMLMIAGPRGVLLEQRPAPGLWGGLWGFPEVASEDHALAWCRIHLGVEPAPPRAWEPFVHTFTHFRLRITPLLVRLEDPAGGVMEGAGRVWYNSGTSAGLGLAAPVARLLNTLNQEEGQAHGSNGELHHAG